MLPQSPLVIPGAVIANKYELDELLGYGGMGTVWTAVRKSDDLRVAIKFVSTAHTESEESLRRFAVEARAAATLRGRHVVQVFENGQLADGTPFMVMELLEGEALSDRLKSSGPLALEEAFRIIRHVGDALAAAHDQGIIHRDIKPENVFLSNTANGYVAKVLDFGVAKFLEGKGASNARTKTGVLVGTPLYMSPEQVRGLKTVDYRSDIYALGALGYAMLTGHEIFAEENFGELLFKICTSDLPNIRDENPDIPQGIDDWFHKSCARSPEDRFSDVRIQVQQFGLAAGIPMAPSIIDTPPEATDSQPRETSTQPKSNSRRPAVFVLVAVAVLSLLALAVALVWSHSDSASRRETPAHTQTH